MKYNISSEISLDQSDNSEQSSLSIQSDDNERTVKWEKLIDDITPIIKPFPFLLLPLAPAINVLLMLDLRDFLNISKTSLFTKNLCATNLIKRLILEKRYKGGLPKYIPHYSENTFPIEGQTKMFDINTLLITAAHGGYTEDLHLLLNTPCVLAIIQKGDAYTALVTAVLSEQIGIVKLIVSHKIIKEKFTSQELQKVRELSNNKRIKKLIKKKEVFNVRNFVTQRILILPNTT